MSKRKFLSINNRLLRKANVLKIVQNVSTTFLAKQFELKWNWKIWQWKKILQRTRPNTNNTTLLVLHITTMTLNSPLLILWKFDNEEEITSILLLSLATFRTNRCTVNIAVYGSNAGGLKLIISTLLPT